MSYLIRTYGRFIEKKGINIVLLFMICLLMQKLSFTAIVEANLEGSGKILYTHVYMTVQPGEEVSGIQLEYAYNIQHWEFVSAFPGETLYASEKQLQIAPGYGSLRILIVGFNNYPIASGELFTLQFSALTEGTDKLGFRILSVKLSSPRALPVNGTINNKEEEGISNSDNSEFEKESDLVDTTNATTSSETTHQTYTESSTVTNPGNGKPNTRELEESSVAPTSSQPSSTKTYSSVLSSGYFPETNNPYIHSRKYQDNNKKEIQTNISNPITLPQKPPIIERQNISNSRTALINGMPNLSNKNVKTAVVSRNAQIQQATATKTLDNSPADNIKLSAIKDNLATHPLSGNVNNVSHNTYLALNVSNLSSTRGRSNECTQRTATNLLIDNIPQKENTLTLLVSIIITVLMSLILLPTVLKKKLFSSKEKLRK